MKSAYSYLARIIAVLVVAQVALIAWAIFVGTWHAARLPTRHVSEV